MPRPGREAPDKIAAAAWGPARQCNQRNAHGGGKPDPIGWRGLGRTKMTDWKAHMDMLVEGTIALTEHFRPITTSAAHLRRTGPDAICQSAR
jgi:hypothetical protein